MVGGPRTGRSTPAGPSVPRLKSGSEGRVCDCRGPEPQGDAVCVRDRQRREIFIVLQSFVKVSKTSGDS